MGDPAQQRLGPFGQHIGNGHTVRCSEAIGGRMGLSEYGVLKGRAVDAREGSGKNPHYQIRIVDDTTEYRIAVNVQSQDHSEVEYAIVSHFEHPTTDGLHELSMGFTRLESRPGGIALDYIRGNLLDPAQMIPLPIS